MDVLFLEVDGIRAPLQQNQKSNREVKLGIAHEGWKRRHPKSEDYELVNKLYFHTLEDGETFWETFSRQLYEQYDIHDDTYIVINGDGAPWIRAGVDYFPRAIYNDDHYHLKEWIQKALSNRTKQERRKIYQAADNRDPSALLAAIAKAEKEETDDKKKDHIVQFRHFVLDHQEAVRDYRERLREQGVETGWMRPMGAAESNMNFFSKRLKKMGYSWSTNGLEAMVRAIIHHFYGTLEEALRIGSSRDDVQEKPEQETFSIGSLLKQKTRQSVGAIMGSMPLLQGRAPNSYTAQALRGLTGLQS